MRKILVSLLAIAATSAFAVDNSQFQAFDNEVNIGYGMQQTNSKGGLGTLVGGGDNVLNTSNLVNLEAERLLNNGIWIDLNANMAFGAGPANFGNSNGASNYGFNGKVGYAFPLLNQHLQLTPYVLAGINNNATALDNFGGVSSPSSQFTANQFFYTGGVGGRLEYRINSVFLVYADQLVAYNWDQTGYDFGVPPQNNVQYTSTVGAKFNLVDNFQLGVKGFYTNYQQQASNMGGLVMQAENGFGGLVTLGLTY